MVVLALGAVSVPAASAHPGLPGPCAEGQALESLGRLDAAQTAYLYELSTPSGVACARAGLARLERGDELCAYAAALGQVGERQSAHAAYLRVLAMDPSSICAIRGAKETRASATAWSWLSAAAKNAGYVVAGVLLAVLLLAVIVLLLLQVLTRMPTLRDWWPAKNIRRPSLQISAFDDTALKDERWGPAIAGLVRGRVTWRTDRFGLNLISGQAGIASALSGLGDISDEAKAAVAVINFLTALLPRRRFVLEGELQPLGAQGAGISLELSRGGGAEALITFWGLPFGLTPDQTGVPTADYYQQLAVAAAAWVDIWLAKAIDGKELLTGDPQSWAFFRTGVVCQQLGHTKRARMLYEQALAKDGRNVGALANLGIMCRRDGQYKRAEEYLNRALQPVADESVLPKLRREQNPDWYRIEYQLAALYANWATGARGDQRAARLREAALKVRALARATLRTIDKDPGHLARGNAPIEFVRDTLRPFLSGTIEPSVLVLAASTAQDPLPPRPADWPPTERPASEAIIAGLGEAPADQAAPLAKIDPWPLIAFVEQGPNRPPAVLFNLACFYTRACDLTTAPERLLDAVRDTPPPERQALAAVAQKDPALAPLLIRRPGTMALVRQILDPETEARDGDEALIAGFERQSQIRDELVSDHWDVRWVVDRPDLAFIASRDDKWLLVDLADSEGLTEDMLEDTYGRLGTFRRDNDVDGANVRALLVLSPAVQITATNRNRAAELDIFVRNHTPDGLGHISWTGVAAADPAS